MLDKFNKCLLVFILMLTLVACGGSKDKDEEIDVVSAYDIKLVFDSEYEFKINNDDAIAFAHANDPKNDILKKLNVLDMPYNDAIKQVLADAYIASPDKVTAINFTINGIDDVEKLVTTRYNLYRDASNFLALNNLGIDVFVDGVSSDDLVKDGYGNITELSLDKDGTSYTYSFNPSGEIAKSSLVKDGITTIKTFENTKVTLEEVIDANGEKTSTSFDSNGEILKLVKESKDGITTEQYFENKLVIKELITSKDGYKEEKKFNNEGVIEAKFITDKDGNKESYSYHNGKVVLSTMAFKDNSFEESTYDENGKQLSFTARYSNGSTKDVFFENGVITKEIYNYPDKHHAEFIYTNGTKTSAEIIDENGSQISQAFFSDGTTVEHQKTIFTDGRSLEESFNDSGILLNSKEYLNDQSTIERSYYPSGNVHVEKITDASGKSQVNNYDESGNLIKD